MWRRVAVRYSVAMAEHLVPWALLAAFLLGSAVGIVSTFALVGRTPPRLHAWSAGERRPHCIKRSDRVVQELTRDAAFGVLDRARLCGANVCRACLDRLRER